MSAPELAGYRHVYSGKVRDLYVPESASVSGPGLEDSPLTLVVSSDRISAYDWIVGTEIPDKGAILNQLSLWWFGQLDVPNHLLEPAVAEAAGVQIPADVAGRSMLVKSLTMIPVECVVRGYLSGSGLSDYQMTGAVMEHQLPENLVDGSALPEPIFTPAAKAELGEHDENITFDQVVEKVGAALAEKLRERSLALYTQGATIAEERGLILADTKFEFGLDENGELVLADEVLTPDSSRYWDKTSWNPGGPQPSFDKQFVRDWLSSPEANWDKKTQPPALPAQIVERTRERYAQCFAMLTGHTPELG